MGNKEKEYCVVAWDFEQYKTTISHSETCLPEGDIQYELIKSSGF